VLAVVYYIARSRVEKGIGASSEVPAALQQYDICAGFGEFHRGRQAGETATNDYDSLAQLRSPETEQAEA
jgi:hypothetical protein